MHRIVRNLRDRGTWLVVSGQTGTAKSHVARKVARWWDTQKITAWDQGWLPWSDLPAAEFVLWPLACTADNREWIDWLWQIRAARVVVIDDLGAESDRFRSGVPQERLLEVLNTCEGKWTMITTNVHPDHWAKRFDQRIADRLSAGAHVGLWEVPSYRNKLRK